MVDKAGEQLQYLQKDRNAFLSQFFERIHEQHKLQKELWEMYYQAKEDNDKKLQLECIQHLREVSVVLTDLYNIVPNFAELHFESDNIPEVKKYDEENNPEWRVSGGIADFDPEAKF